MQTNTPITRFFALYLRQITLDDIPAVVSHFADPFLYAGRSGSEVVRVADFAMALPKRKTLFNELGCQPAQLVSVHEMPLDSQYVLTRTTWRFSFLRANPPAQQFDVDSTFLIHTGSTGTDENEFKILVYLSHQDILQLLNHDGIIHAEEAC